MLNLNLNIQSILPAEVVVVVVVAVLAVAVAAAVVAASVALLTAETEVGSALPPVRPKFRVSSSDWSCLEIQD